MVERTPSSMSSPRSSSSSACVLALAPFAIVAIAATHDLRTVNQVPMPLVPGHDFLDQRRRGLARGPISAARSSTASSSPAASRSARSSSPALSAFSLVYFRYRGRMLIFWLIFITLMLPLEVRIVPTYAVAANVLSPYQTLLDLTGISWLVEQVTGYRSRCSGACSIPIPA